MKAEILISVPTTIWNTYCPRILIRTLQTPKY